MLYMKVMKHLKIAMHIGWQGIVNPKAFYLHSSVFAGNEMARRKAERHGFSRGLPETSIVGLFGQFEQMVRPYAFLGGGSTAMDLALLRLLAKQHKNCSYLEIGTWRGESLANAAQEAERCMSISLSDSMMSERGFGGPCVRTAKYYSKDLKNVEHIEANSLDYDFTPFRKSMDLVFIDGDHSYRAIVSDTRNAYSLLRNRDSVIVWHDYRKGDPEGDICWETLAGILDGLPSSEHQHIFHVSNTLCAIFLRKPVAKCVPEVPSVPKASFSVRIEVCT